MSPATDSQRDLAAMLLAQEGESDGHAGRWASAAARLHEKISRQLAPLIGEAGIAALFARSARLTRAGLPAHVVLTGPMEGPVVFLTQLEPDLALEAATSMYATFLALLTSLIGERLTRQLLRRACPAIDSFPKESS